jgi:hypothetical protein
MFGTKQAKHTRLQKLATLVEKSPHGITLAELVRDLRTPRLTKMRDRAVLEEDGILRAMS